MTTTNEDLIAEARAVTYPSDLTEYELIDLIDRLAANLATTNTTPSGTNQQLIAETRKRLADHPHGWLPSDVTTMRRLIAALAAVPAPTEADIKLREVLARSIDNWDARLVRKYPEAAHKYMAEMAGFISRTPVPKTQDGEALEWWEKFSDRLAEQMGQSWDADEAQEAIIERFVKRYGELDGLIDTLDYEREVDDVVRIEFNRSTFQWSITGVAPKARDGFEATDEMVERMARMLFRRTVEGRSGWTWPVNGSWGRERDLADARKVLEYVLTPVAVPVSPEGGETK